MGVEVDMDVAMEVEVEVDMDVAVTDLRRVGGPREGHQGSDLWRFARVRPAGLVAEPEHVERADGEIAAVWRPRDAADRVLA